MSNESNESNLSDQALGSIMMALQKSLLNQSDIVPILKGLRFRNSEQGLVIMNPPTFKLDYEEISETDFEQGNFNQGLSEEEFQNSLDATMPEDS